MENKRGLKLIDRKYRNYFNNLMVDSDRVDTYAELISECVDELGVIIFDEFKYRLTDGEDVNNLFLEVLSRLPNSGYLNKLKGEVEYFSDKDWLNKYIGY